MAGPYARFASRLCQVFITVAREAADAGKPGRTMFAERILDALGGASCHNMVLAGVMADFRWEVADAGGRGEPRLHIDSGPGGALSSTARSCVRGTGATLTDASKDTFTRQVFDFLRKPSILHGDRAQVFELPGRGALLEPLNRMRAVVANVKRYLMLYRPSDSWQNKLRALRLPSPCF